MVDQDQIFEEVEMEAEETDIPMEVLAQRSTWAQQLIPNTIAPSSSPDRSHLYMGEDEEERYPGIDELFMTHSESDDQPPKFGPRVDIFKEKYFSLLNNGGAPSL